MIQLNKIIRSDVTTKTVVADLIADNSLEVEDIGNKAYRVIGLEGYSKLGFGSTCFTASMEFGMLDSEGIWRFQ